MGMVINDKRAVIDRRSPYSDRLERGDLTGRMRRTERKKVGVPSASSLDERLSHQPAAVDADQTYLRRHKVGETPKQAYHVDKKRFVSMILAKAATTPHQPRRWISS